VLAEIPERNIVRELVGDQLLRGTRDEDLPTMAGRADPRCAMDIQADVVIHRDRGLAGM
jgi:hypothetical protein